MRIPFAAIETTARRVHPELDTRLSLIEPAERYAAPSDDRWLAAIVRRVFEAGFVWHVVAAKWAGFESVFHRFDPVRLALEDNGFYERALADQRIIRNRQKVMAVAANAEFVLRYSEMYDGFGRFVAGWPQDDPVGLWKVFARDGARLGGSSAAIVLRRMGRDTFILSNDVIRGLLRFGLIDRAPTGWREKRRIQDLFLVWQASTGRPLAHLSVIVACAAD